MIKVLAEDDIKIKNIVYAFTYFWWLFYCLKNFESYGNGIIDKLFTYNIEY